MKSTTDCSATVYDWERELFHTPQVWFEVEGLLSPSGARFAIASDGGWTNVYEDFVLKSQLPAMYAVRWIDEEYLLVRRAGGPSIVDLMGNARTTLASDFVGAVRAAGPGRIHDGERIYSVSDGKVIWSARDAGLTPDQYAATAVIGDYFVYKQGTTLRVAKIDGSLTSTSEPGR